MSKHYLLFLLFVIATVARSQQSPVAAGQTAASSTGNISYSVGQMDFEVQSNDTHLMIQGVQQPFEISVLQGPTYSVYPKVSLYPNPTTRQLVLDIDLAGVNRLLYQWFDAAGKALTQPQPIIAPTTRLDVDAWAEGVYMLQLQHPGQPPMTYKILKRNP